MNNAELALSNEVATNSLGAALGTLAVVGGAAYLTVAGIYSILTGRAPWPFGRKQNQKLLAAAS